jgi:hypothetical protein
MPVPPAPPAPPPTRSKREKGAAEDIAGALRAPVKDSRELVHVTLTLPKAHLRVLETEAAMLNLRRYQFIELLFLSELDQPILVRPNYMPAYTFTREEIRETERILVYLRPEVKKRFDDFLGRQGIRPSSWVSMAVARWANLQEALRAVK